MKFPKPWYRKSRGAWFVTLDGQQIKLGTTKSEAFQRYKEILNKPRQQTASSDSILVIIEAFLEWSQKNQAPDTYEWYRYRLESFARRYPDLRSADIRPYHVTEWLDATDVSNGTKRNHGRAIKRCMRWAKQQGYIDQNPIADVPLPRGGKRETVLSDEEFETILELVPDQGFRDLLVVTWETGCRPQESLVVEARHVDLANQRWVFPESESKTNIPRVVYLTDKALEITKRLTDVNRVGPLFRNSRGKPWTTDAVNCAFTRIQLKLGRRVIEENAQHQTKDKRRKYLAVDDSLAEQFMETLNPVKESGEPKRRADLLHEARKKLTHKKAMQAAPKYCLYTLRHTWMNRLLTNGVDALTVAFLAGHSDPSTLAKVYAHLTNNPAYLLEQAKKASN